RGQNQAILVAVGTGVLAMMMPPLSLLSGAAVALTTLRSGMRSGAVVMLGSTAFVAGLTWLSLGNVLPALMFLGVLWLPLWGLGFILRETRSLALTTMAAGIFGIIGIIATYLILGDVTSWWKETLTTLFEPAMEAGGPLADPELVEKVLADLSKVMTGIAAAGFMLNTILCLYLARGWQAQLFNPGGFRSEFHELRFGHKAAVVSLAVIVLSMVPLGGLSNVAAEIMIVVLSLYVIQGLAMIHAVVAIKNLHVAWLIGVYMVAFFILPQLMAVVALLGLVDTWVDFRQRASVSGA
ncbi:MAG: DUF2232 domain-containing protein, partial [Gammaproteobacteria bacterium]|nr:DUF2232 domain-containing protein [Gammaproteobacteria bacterium]